MMDSEELASFTDEFYKACIYMHLNDPQLTVPLRSYKEREFEYCSFRKKEAYCIDGFAKEGAESIIVLPPVMRNNFPFNGLKPSVLIL